MSALRSSDTTATTRFRSDRICAINHEFFFDTREGHLVGPFASREEALQGVEDYIRQCMGQPA